MFAENINKMKKITYILIGILLTIFISGKAFSQAREDSLDKYTYFDLTTESIEQYLSPLKTLIDSAIANSPLLKYQNAQRIIAKLNTKSVRRRWSKYLGVRSDVKYGLFDNLVLSQDASGNINSSLGTTTEQTRYSGGIYVKFPLQELLDRNNRIQIAKQEQEMALQEYKSRKRKLRKLVIQQFNDLLLAQKVLRIKNTYKQDVMIQKQMAEQKFKNNQISVSEMTKMSSMYSKAMTEYETAKSEFNNAYLMLQEIVGVKFNLKSKINK